MIRIDYIKLSISFSLPREHTVLDFTVVMDRDSIFVAPIQTIGLFESIQHYISKIYYDIL